MNESLTYQAFIDNILQTRGRFACGDEYYERHHIVPKCLGGTNEENNLIDLFAREHFEAHRLLALENPENAPLVNAWWMMTVIKNDYQDRTIVSAKEYEIAKKEYSKIVSARVSGENHPMFGVHRNGKDNPFYGHKHTDETKRKIAEARKGKYFGANCPVYGKHLSLETKQKLSKALKLKHVKKVVCDDIVFDSLCLCADFLGVSDSYLSNILAGRKHPKKMLSHNLHFLEEEKNASN